VGPAGTRSQPRGPSFLLETRLPLRPDTIGAACGPVGHLPANRKKNFMQHAHSMAAEHQEAAEKVHRPSVVPHFINEDKSDMRGIKSGWYAMNNDGRLVGGPFGTYEKCVERLSGSIWLSSSMASSADAARLDERRHISTELMPLGEDHAPILTGNSSLRQGVGDFRARRAQPLRFAGRIVVSTNWIALRNLLQATLRTRPIRRRSFSVVFSHWASLLRFTRRAR
jgi:hypothetical protein